MSYILAQGWANPKVAVTNLIYVRAYVPVSAPAHYANARVYERARNNCVIDDDDDDDDDDHHYKPANCS